ncbi:MAG: hypothetical protein ABIO67_03130, partial [Mycobacteriales bacterium]
QLVMLANRHDWLSAFSNELGVVLAVERMLGMEVPARAVWLRTLLAEVNRVLASLMFLGTFPLEIGTSAPLVSALQQREALQDLMEEATGARVHYMFNRVGGLLADVPEGWTDRARTVLAAVGVAVEADLAPVIRTDPLFAERTIGVGVLTAADALSYGASGPVARASGVDLDLRRDDPYLAYGDLAVEVVGDTAGDSNARFRCLLDQVAVSLDLARQCLAALPGGPVNLKLPKTVRAPEGSIYVWTENPLGAMGYYLVSKGERTPYRLAMRTASFNNVAVLPSVLPGTKVADLVTVLASLFFVVGDIDK